VRREFLYFKILFIFIIIILSVFLVNLSYDKISKRNMIKNCVPDDRGIFENDLFHHTLMRCNHVFDKGEDGDGNTEYIIEVFINSLGFRNKEYEFDKGDGTSRIILLGDSFTFGYGLELEDTFFINLEKELNRKVSNKVEVWNLAATSWGTLIHYLVTKHKVVNYDPDLVILMFDTSDYVDNQVYLKYGVFENGSLVGIKPEGDLFAERETLLYNTTPRLKFVDLIDDSFIYIFKMSEILEKENIPFLVVFYPYPHTNIKHNNLLTEKLNEVNISTFDLTPVFKERNDSGDYFEYNRHWSKQGSKVATRELKDYILGNYRFT